MKISRRMRGALLALLFALAFAFSAASTVATAAQWCNCAVWCPPQQEFIVGHTNGSYCYWDLTHCDDCVVE
jgi:hypothetical protein